MRKVTIAFAATIALLVAGVLAWNAQAAPFAGLPPQIITHQSKGWGAADLDVAHGDVPGSAAPVVAGAHLVRVGALRLAASVRCLGGRSVHPLESEDVLKPSSWIRVETVQPTERPQGPQPHLRPLFSGMQSANPLGNWEPMEGK
jgi:hypothetical protein